MSDVHFGYFTAPGTILDHHYIGEVGPIRECLIARKSVFVIHTFIVLDPGASRRFFSARNREAWQVNFLPSDAL